MFVYQRVFYDPGFAEGAPKNINISSVCRFPQIMEEELGKHLHQIQPKKSYGSNLVEGFLVIHHCLDKWTDWRGSGDVPGIPSGKLT